MENYEKKYKEALKAIKELSDSQDNQTLTEELEKIFPELAESEDEKIRKEIVDFICWATDRGCITSEQIERSNSWFAWLEKQGEQKKVEWSQEDLICLGYLADFVDKNGDDFYGKNKPNVVKWIRSFVELSTHIPINEIRQKPVEMIQWNGVNLQEVLNFTGKSKNFDKWFKSQEEFENYVHSHGDIFKLFDEEGNHFEIPVGAWIIKTPDGHNVASQFRFQQKPVEWSEEDETHLRDAIYAAENIYTDKCGKEELVNWLKSLKDRVLPQPQSEWSEEDEKFFKTALWHISYSISNGKSTDCHCDTTDWFKSLKGRVLPQPQQEWSRDDEQYLLVCKNALAKYQASDKWDAVLISRWLENRLKSLRPPYYCDNCKLKMSLSQWKPTEEHLKGLRRAIHNSEEGSDAWRDLKDLYEQLKAL